LLQIRKGKLQKPSENLITRASLQICHNDARVPEDIVGKLWLDTYLNGFWEEPRQSVILIVEVQDQWRGPLLVKVGN